MRRACVIFWMFLAVFPLLGEAAELTPRGPEHVVNQYTRGFQSTPDVASLGTAGMVAVWVEGEDADGGIKARLLDAAGVPVSAEFWVEQSANAAFPPRVASNGQGLWVVVWGGPSGTVWVRRFQRDQPLGAPFQVQTVVSLPSSYAIPDVDMDPAGNFIVVWFRQQGVQQRIMARRFGPDGLPSVEVLQVNASVIQGGESFIDLRTALLPDGGFVATWNASGARLRRYNGPNRSWEEEVFVSAQADFLMPVLYADGGGAVVWVETVGGKVRARRFDNAGRLTGPDVEVGSYSDVSEWGISVVLDRGGNALVVWPSSEGIKGRLFDPLWQPLGNEALISLGEFYETEPVAAASPAGGFVALWTTGAIFRGYYPGIPPPPATGRDGDALGIASRNIADLCSPDAATLCLGQGGRFSVRVTWRKPSGEEGVGSPLALTRETGAFWFFGPSNLELMVKMIDGQEVNGYYWVYTGALSDVEYTLTVHDSITRTEKSYRNPPRQIASRADVDAFPSAEVSYGDSPIPGGAEALFLGEGGRFRVSVEFRNPYGNGAMVPATAIPLTEDTGAFWFFGPRNLELMIKVLDGRPVNGRFWVYYGALSDVLYRITVRDTVTGKTKTYENVPGRLVSRADGEAF